MVAFHLPSSESLARFLAKEQLLDITYPHRGASALPHPVAGFDNDFQRVQIGQGITDFKRAAEALRNWQMFPPVWTIILPKAAPIEAGNTIAMFAKGFGLWWRNSCRIIYTIDEPQRFGFAYGTLPGHIECGEELFLVEMDEAGQVWYTLRAFSTPRNVLVKIAYPLMRNFQARFRRDSAQAMRAAVASTHRP